MKKWFKSNHLYFIGALIGAVAGYFYWQQVGCASGTCAITSSPINSTAYGAIMGSLLLSLFKRGPATMNTKTNNTENEI